MIEKSFEAAARLGISCRNAGFMNHRDNLRNLNYCRELHGLTSDVHYFVPGEQIAYSIVSDLDDVPMFTDGTNEPKPPEVIALGYLGSRWGVAAVNEGAFPCWEHTSSEKRYTIFETGARAVKPNMLDIDYEAFFVKELKNSPRSVCLVVPVFNAPHHVRDLLRDLSSNLWAPQGILLRLIISDDGSEKFTQDIIKDEAQKIRDALPNVNVELKFAEKNRGFIGHCNDLLGHDDSEIFVVLTTDVRLPKYFLPRLLMAFSDPTVAIATPYAANGANLNLPVPDGYSWTDVDHRLLHRAPSYPDAETTVGYCMAVRRGALGKEPLFSTEFENGYGEDSDLYYRMVSSGKRGVLVDNLMVYHHAGASYDALPNADELRAGNWALFMEIWGDVYRRRIGARSNAIESARKRLLGSFSHDAPGEIDVLFVLPTDDRRIGGVAAVYRLTEKLLERGWKAQVVGLSACDLIAETEPLAKSVQLNGDRLREHVRRADRVGWLVATAHNTAPVVRDLSRYCGARTAYFVQGPEQAFSGGQYAGSVTDSYVGFDRLMCVSPFLQDLVEGATGTRPALVPYGPDPWEFHLPSETVALEEREDIVVAQMSGRAEKGSGLVGLALHSLIKSGFHVEVFGIGEQSFQLPRQVRAHGFLGRRQLRSLFRRAKFYLDVSQFEGLGMLALEAAFSGCVPVMLENGGSSGILKRHSIGVRLSGLDELIQLGPLLRGIGKLPIDRERIEAVREHHNLEAAAEGLVQILSLGEVERDA